MTERLITAELIRSKLARRGRDIHKGNCGRLLIVAGSEGMTGAAVLACRGALRSGAGLVQLAVPGKLFPIAQAAVPEATCLDRRMEDIDLSRYDAAALGPGLGTGEESVECVRYILRFYEGPLVLDADGLNIVAEQKMFGLLRERKGETVITPHEGEARRLLEAASGGAEFQGGRADEARRLRGITGATVVLKGSGTIVDAADDETYRNTTGNPGMATGGSGDVLTGVITGIWGQTMGTRKLTGAEAAVCGVFIHGLAGDLAAEVMGEYGIIAGDIVDHVPFAIKSIMG